MKTEMLDWLRSAAQSVQRIKREFEDKRDNFKRLLLRQLEIPVDSAVLSHTIGDDENDLYAIVWNSHVRDEEGGLIKKEIKIPLSEEEFELIRSLGFSVK